MIGSKFSRHFSNQSGVKPKPIVARACSFSRALCRLRVITSSFDGVTGLSPTFLIGQSNYFGFGLIETRSSLSSSLFVSYSSTLLLMEKSPGNEFVLHVHLSVIKSDNTHSLLPSGLEANSVEQRWSNSKVVSSVATLVKDFPLFLYLCTLPLFPYVAVFS